MPVESGPRRELYAGLRAELPILLGVAPFGMIYGALARASGLPTTTAQAMSAIVFAGSAQFIAVQLIAAGAPVIVLLMTTLIVNIRHLLYSASVAPYLRELRPAWKWLLAYLLTDEAYAVAILHYQQTDDAVHDRGPTDVEAAPTVSAHPIAEPTLPHDPSLTVSPRHPVTPSPRHRVTVSPQRHWYFLGAGLALWATWQMSTAVGIFLA
ncbi:MAG: AzlC family ABC transporter permease, partial [Anaerolineae bacterium]